MEIEKFVKLFNSFTPDQKFATKDVIRNEYEYCSGIGYMRWAGNESEMEKALDPPGYFIGDIMKIFDAMTCKQREEAMEEAIGSGHNKWKQ